MKTDFSCVYVHAHTRSALDTSERIKSHIQQVICADTCTHTHTLSSAYRPTRSDINTCSLRHIEIRAQPLVQAIKCRYTFSPWCTLKHADTLGPGSKPQNSETSPTLDTCRHMQTHAQLFWTKGTEWRCTHTSRGTCRQHTCSFLRQRKLNEDAHSPLETCQQTLTSRNMPTNAHLLKHANKRSLLEVHADNTRSAPSDTWNWMKMHAQVSKHANKRSPTCRQHTVTLSSRYRPRNADTHLSLNTSQGMQMHAQPLIRADTCRKMPSLGYLHTHSGLLYVHVHA